MEIKPYQILFFKVSVIVILALLLWLFPADGIKLSEDIKLELPTLKQVLDPEEIKYKDISHLIERSKLDTLNAPNLTALIMHDLFNKDTFEFRITDTYADTIRIDIENINTVTYALEFPHNDKSILYSFFWQLKNHEELIRILHYGDSQLEGDRITSFLRNRLQSHFGGYGPGLLPAKQPYNYGRTIKHSWKGRWRRYSTMEHAGMIKGRRFGVLAGFSRFAPLNYPLVYKVEPPDSVVFDSAQLDTNTAYQPPQDSIRVIPANDGNTLYNASITLRKSKRAYPNDRKFDVFRIIYGYNQSPVETSLYVNGQYKTSKKIPVNNSLQQIKWRVNSPDRLTVEFSGYDSPDIYAIGLDAAKGVAVDNIPMRGSSGTMITKMNRHHLEQMLKMLNVKLIIMQFGGNVTPYITSDYSYYQKMFSAQLRRIKEIDPDLSIIVIGPADMSRKVNGNFVSYPNIPHIRDALRNAAFENGAAFWDMYEAMGGRNSMPSWVGANPPLAAKDFTHFTRAGSEIIAKMFYNALINEYNQYLQYHTTHKQHK